ncbi:hypothetical protein quinque_011289 [Culex quinquefasciatus]
MTEKNPNQLTVVGAFERNYEANNYLQALRPLFEQHKPWSKRRERWRRTSGNLTAVSALVRPDFFEKRCTKTKPDADDLRVWRSDPGIEKENSDYSKYSGLFSYHISNNTWNHILVDYESTPLFIVGCHRGLIYDVNGAELTNLIPEIVSTDAKNAPQSDDALAADGGSDPIDVSLNGGGDGQKTQRRRRRLFPHQLSEKQVFADGPGHSVDLGRHLTVVFNLLFFRKPSCFDFVKPFCRYRINYTQTSSFPPRQIK